VVERALKIDRLSEAIGQTLGGRVDVVLHERGRSRGLQPGRNIELELVDGSAVIALGIDPALCSMALSRLLGRPVQPNLPNADLDARLRGALSALVLDAARRAGGRTALRIFERTEPDGESATASATLLFNDQPFEIFLAVRARFEPSDARESVSLTGLGELEIQLPLVAGVSCARREDLTRLEVGDAWMPGAGWWLDSDLCGRAALCAPTGETGAAVLLSRDGTIVVGEREVSVSMDTEEPTQDQLTGAQAADDQHTPSALVEALVESPIVVRVELGAVSMTARQWARLRPGDVIGTGRRIAEPAVLRVAGREVAQGELVSIDGELGVRIRKLGNSGDERSS
jgi:flagellar motor switch/type III secretory pathway protein FliN